MKYKPTHPYAMTTYIYSFSFLLIIPIIQQIVFKPDSFYDVIITFWKSIILTFIILLWSFLKYRSITYCIAEKKLFIKHGILLKRDFVIPYENIYAITIKNKVSQTFFGAVKLIFNIPAKNKYASLILSNKNALMVVKSIFTSKHKKTIYKAKMLRIILMSAFWANPLTSLLITIPFVKKTGNVLGQELSEKLYSAVDIRVILIAIGISPLIATIIYLLASAFLITFIIQYFRYSNFKAGISDDYIFVSHGLINKNGKIIKKSVINAVSINQTLLMRILKLYNAYIHTVNFIKNENDKTLLIAASKKEQLVYDLEKLVPIKIINSKKFKPAKKTLKKFIFAPGICFFLLIFFMCRLKEEIWYTQIIALFLKLIMVFLLWWFFFRVQAYKISGISFSENVVKICGYKKLNLFSSYIPIKKIQSIEIRRTPFQRVENLASIKIYIFSEEENYFSCNHLKYEYVKNFVESVESVCDFQGVIVSKLD
ncbi:MAG: hypothetical protein RUMPE_01264 [Eubacteriales bacterium SKADARSKE-1]|nr:hypothetical protein [Eubacteriales bacterium SKADARSKE-1]